MLSKKNLFQNKKKRVVLITGATRGIGAAIAEVFHKEGAILLLTGTHPKEIDSLNKMKTDDNRQYVCVDFSIEKSLRAFLEVLESLDRLDVCVNNAGINIIKEMDKVTYREFDRLTAINYRAPYLISQAAARVMKRNSKGWIVNIGSIWSTITKPGRSSYCASKAGLAGMTRGIAVDLAPFGVIVNCVSPGFIMTDLTRQSLSNHEIKQITKQIPIGHMGDSLEIARIVAFLCSYENTYLTGQNIVVDGGYSLV